jgi:outer membrane protein OmpA-like peptidoglycan-associated protein
MKKNWCVLFMLVAACLALVVASAPAQAQDQEGCKDHPLFNRMPNHHISKCETVEFDSRKFPIGPPLAELKPKHVEVEGTRFLLMYELNEGGKQISGLQVMRNFENATKSAGGTVLGTYPEWCKAYIEYDPSLGNSCANYGVSMKFLKGNKEIWAYMQVTGDTNYGIQIIEKESMQQSIVVDAALLQQGLADSGHIAVYDLLFDTGKSDVKPESDASLKEIAKLLTQNAALKLHVVGHTDNVGDPAMNMKLSQARAAAVVTALTSKYGVAANRLTPFGAGPYAPVASNKTDEGKAKNRRVELVEQ